MAGPEPLWVHCSFAAMSLEEITIHIAILVVAALGILIALAGIAFWWVSRKMKRLT